MRFIYFMFVGLFMFAVQAHAQVHISVDTVQRYFLEGSKKFQTLRVRNNHPKDTFEIGAELFRYVNIGDRTAKTAQFEPVQGHFLLAPKNFVLKPGQTRSVRLVYTKDYGEQETVYRLAFKPREVEKEFENNEQAQSIKPSTKIVTAAGMLVLVSPKDPVLKVTHVRDESGIVFTNEGNIAADFRFTREYCYSSDNGNGCMELTGKRIYPGETWRFEIDPSIPLRWAISGYNQLRDWVEVDPLSGY